MEFAVWGFGSAAESLWRYRKYGSSGKIVGRNVEELVE
jgi:hypothetical protein